MTQPKHTPAPWSWERENSLKIRISDKRGFEIANSVQYSCGYKPRPAWYDEYNNAQMEANAHLIAAAPELLEALEGFLSYFDGYENDYADEENKTIAVFNHAREAIAKAEGK